MSSLSRNDITTLASYDRHGSDTVWSTQCKIISLSFFFFINFDFTLKQKDAFPIFECDVNHEKLIPWEIE